MNRERWKRLGNILSLLSEARAFLEEIAEDERAAVDNMPEAFKDTEKGERREEIATMLEESVDILEELENSIGECTS